MMHKVLGNYKNWKKNIKLFKTKPVTKFLQEKFHLLVDNGNQF